MEIILPDPRQIVQPMPPNNGEVFAQNSAYAPIDDEPDPPIEN